MFRELFVLENDFKFGYDGQAEGGLWDKPPSSVQKLFMAAGAKDFSGSQGAHYKHALAQYGSVFSPFPPADDMKHKPEVWEIFWDKFGAACLGTGLSKDHGVILMILMAPERSTLSNATRSLKLKDG